MEIQILLEIIYGIMDVKIINGVYGHPKNKIMRALLRPKTDNILAGLGWVMTYSIRAVKSPRVGVCNPLGELHIGKTR